ncbi:hypothetical protein [Actinomycetospora termitidis]|uniref:Uncharacterized protein n=1 Tax=Actinomycetospora termitidis TaxID=3053470 RepID=A0ABT7M8X0_9PSEU|nr:hypothetical protein [Actinomycetospora sp. Odt1-22]MDL5157116.1 hypothetical protein [Actinomycetospora sp. Odt1-22]
MTTLPIERTDDELRWEFYRAALAAWADAAGRAPVPAPRESPEYALRRVPR